MKKNILKWNVLPYLLIGALALGLWSCGDDEPAPEDTAPNASFQEEVTDFTVAFTNFSQNATNYSWDFGDGNSSTDESPSHTYDEAGTYTVVLTATNDAGDSDDFSKDLNITDPDEALTLLTGTESKTWKLYREGTSMQLGPNSTNPGGWWTGLTNDGSRNCLYEQTFTFTRSGDYIFDDGGMFWGEFGVFNDTDVYEVCFEATADNMKLSDGTDVSAWLSNTHAFTYDPTSGVVTLTGEGAWIGIPKLGTEGENGATITSSVAFNITIEEEDGYDLMYLTFDYGDGDNGGAGLWSFVYASYSDPSLEPALAGAKARAGFEFEYTEGSQSVTFTNTSIDAESYVWDFGDGNTSTEENPVHTFAADGIYDVQLKATNSQGTDSLTRTVFLNVESITDFMIDHESDVEWAVFGGSAVEIVDNPDKSGINTSDKVLQLTHGDQTWAGIITQLDGLLNFEGKTKLKVKLWAPATGTLKYKIEAAGGNPSQEIDLEVATAEEWVELEWDLSTDINEEAVKSDLYSGLVLFPGWNTTTADVYYIDDITME